jgi:predicted secreted protein
MSQTPPSYGGDDSNNQGGAYGAPPPSNPQYGYGGGGPQGSPPPNYLVWAILSTLFCCLPLGIVSIVFAAQVNSKWTSGDAAGAQEASRKARTFALWSTIIGVVVIVIYVVLIAAGTLSMNSSVDSY